MFSGAFLYAPYSFLLISNKFWIGGRVGGSSAVMLLNRTSAGNVTCPHQKHYARGRTNHRCVNSRPSNSTSPVDAGSKNSCHVGIICQIHLFIYYQLTTAHLLILFEAYFFQPQLITGLECNCQMIKVE